MKQTIKVIDITESFGKMLEQKFKDSNNEKDITKAGVWDLCDALSGMNNSKFSKEQAMAEMRRRGM